MKLINKKIILIILLIGFILSLTPVTAEETINSKNSTLNISNDQNNDNTTLFFNITSNNETLDEENNNSSNGSYYNEINPIKEEPTNNDNLTAINNINMENTGLPVLLIFILLALPGIIQKIKK